MSSLSMCKVNYDDDDSGDDDLSSFPVSGLSQESVAVSDSSSPSPNNKNTSRSSNPVSSSAAAKSRSSSNSNKRMSAANRKTKEDDDGDIEARAQREVRSVDVPHQIQSVEGCLRWHVHSRKTKRRGQVYPCRLAHRDEAIGVASLEQFDESKEALICYISCDCEKRELNKVRLSQLQAFATASTAGVRTTDSKEEDSHLATVEKSDNGCDAAVTIPNESSECYALDPSRVEAYKKSLKRNGSISALKIRKEELYLQKVLEEATERERSSRKSVQADAATSRRGSASKDNDADDDDEYGHLLKGDNERPQMLSQGKNSGSRGILLGDEGPREKLRAGDVIEFYPVIGIHGEGPTTRSVIFAVNAKDRGFPLDLQHSTVKIPSMNIIKKVMKRYRGELLKIENPVERPLSQFGLVTSSLSERERSAFKTDMEEIGERHDRHMDQVRKELAESGYAGVLRDSSRKESGKKKGSNKRKAPTSSEGDSSDEDTTDNAPKRRKYTTQSSTNKRRRLTTSGGAEAISAKDEPAFAYRSWLETLKRQHCDLTERQARSKRATSTLTLDQLQVGIDVLERMRESTTPTTMTDLCGALENCCNEEGLIKFLQGNEHNLLRKPDIEDLELKLKAWLLAQQTAPAATKQKEGGST